MVERQLRLHDITETRPSDGLLLQDPTNATRRLLAGYDATSVEFLVRLYTAQWDSFVQVEFQLNAPMTRALVAFLTRALTVLESSPLPRCDAISPEERGLDEEEG